MFNRWRKSKPKTIEPPRFEFVVSLLTDVGCRRELNEDSGRYVQPTDPDLLARKGTLVIVADGMGGHAAGEVASSTAVEVINRVYYEDRADASIALKRAFQKANREIYEASSKDENLKGMGTTCTALVLHDGAALLAHVGDSRLYLVRDSEIYLQTEDHSAVMEMVKRGLLSAEEARRHPDKNLILRAMGRHPDVEVAMWEEPFPLREGDHFVLCSDGLCDLVDDAEMKQAVLENDPHAACEALIALAKQRGGHDNVTVGIVRVQPLGESEATDMMETREVKIAP